jgi:hypothetical protein
MTRLDAPTPPPVAQEPPLLAEPPPPFSPRELVASRVSRRLDVPAWVLITQLFIGFGWLRAATEKVLDPDWWKGETLLGFLDSHQESTLGWYAPFTESVVTPFAVTISIVVFAFQLLAGASLVLGRRIGIGLALGIFLNLHFVAAGAVNPSAFYLLAQGAIALWLAETSRAGPRTGQMLWGTALMAILLGIASAPFISTLDPALVIDDPAVMYVMGAVLTMLGCEIAERRLPAPAPETHPPSAPDSPAFWEEAGTPPVHPRPVRR